MQMITEIMWNNTMIKHNQGRWFWLNKDERSIYKMIEVIIMTLKKANDCDNDKIDNDNNHCNNRSFNVMSIKIVTRRRRRRRRT